MVGVHGTGCVMMGEDELHASGKNGPKYEYERERGTFGILIVIVRM